jgi:hypothetical protein
METMDLINIIERPSLFHAPQAFMPELPPIIGSSSEPKKFNPCTQHLSPSYDASIPT